MNEFEAWPAIKNNGLAALTGMDEVEGPRLKLSTEDAISLASSLAEPINLEDGHYSLLRGELESDGQNLEAESWSVATDPDYLRTLQREAVKRQDVIYELIQTEMHHVRTLKILRHVYMHELRQSLLLDEGKIDMLFHGVDALLALHQHFLSCLKMRQSHSQEEGSPHGYQITELGDILISQFSGTVGEKMKDWYGAFCSHHSAAINLYKEQVQNNKKLQGLMKKIGQLALVRRLGIPECFLLVTQRITKYPVLVERIIQNTEADTDEHQSLLQGLASIKDTISKVNGRVREYEKASRLREIHLRLEPKSVGRLKDGQVFRRDDLIQDNRTLLHEGQVTWKSSARHKDVHAVLLSDVLLLLQDKDQKFVFAAVDNKPPVVSLQNLILREVAHEDKAMFLICACTSEMYELHAGSREERVSWMALIRDAINHYSEEDALHQEIITRLQEYEDRLKERDEQIKRCLSEKLHIYSTLYMDVTGLESPSRGLLLRGDPTDLQQGETLLTGAINEVEKVQNLLFQTRMKDSNDFQGDYDKTQGRRAEAWGVADSNPPTSSMKTHMFSDGDAAEGLCGDETVPLYCTHMSDDPQLKEIYYPESPPMRVDNDDAQTPVSASPPNDFQAEVCDRVILLAQRLYTLQAIVAQQDSQIELQHVLQSKSRPSRPSSSTLLEQEKQRNLEKHKEELANLHKLQVQHRDAQQRWEKERERHSAYMEALEADLKQREDDCRKHEEKLNKEKAALERQRESYQQGLERLRESTKAVEKDKERLSQEKERLEEKLKKYTVTSGHGNYDDDYINLSSYQSFRGSIANGGVGGISRPHVMLATACDPKETPPKVPPRKESISPQPAKPELPIHLISTTNQVHKASVVQQIPTKLANLAKGKEKGFRMKASHQRAHSAASIDVSQVLPIRVTGKEGGSLRGPHSQSVGQSDDLKSPGYGRSVKTSQSFSAHFMSSIEAPPPPPPPFPKEVLQDKATEKVIFL
ncbi:rho guanine nucleotide exchange factor 18a isoform X2 [Dunckerocampus dactyliophorus]|uniref:rho guanine nucleotide exchange factor 18a isoform X2 n=1 Tax=Dunckerocampus dactyliophorus TaxID=161453 RepID=UPI002406C6A2|nr:rho guanine nucleotide exchange factor 18a isoform X2 [Dunckerocampus dactyliophorus]XP_054622989.1 rho guanine nucleotide exchange factor 18a isoform X2 [Dunckerocampus dactyliophorus]